MTPPAQIESHKRRPRSWLSEVPIPMPYIALAILVAMVTTQRPSYLSVAQLNLTTLEAFSLILVTVGQTIVILSGGLDLSVGGVINLTTVLAATQFGRGGAHMVVWILLLLLLGLAIGAVNGAVVRRLRMQPFVVTLATWSILSGVSLLILPTPGGQIPASWLSFGNMTVGGLSIWVMGLAGIAVFWVSFTRRPLGRAIKALGSNSEAAYLAGVRVAPTVVGAYALCGLFAAACGLFLTTQTGGGSPIIGNDFVLPSVAATAIGGTRLTGGFASLAGAIAGAYVLTVINDVVFTFGIPQAWSIVLSGLLLVMAVFLGELRGLLHRWA